MPFSPAAAAVVLAAIVNDVGSLVNKMTLLLLYSALCPRDVKMSVRKQATNATVTQAKMHLRKRLLIVKLSKLYTLLHRIIFVSHIITV